nr:MobA/MobL family protein [Sphingobium nicotianae]
MSKADWAARPQPQATFHDGRDGRTQYRVVGELPAELDAQQCTMVLRELCREFEKRKLPFVAVVHAPDAHNHDANWHFHLIFYDRPCRRVRAAEIETLRRAGVDVGDYKEGDWDFSVRVPVPNRKDRWNYPLRRAKDRAVIHDDYVITLRRSLARVTNQALAKAGIARRIDPGTYEDMKIDVEPQEHLGTTNAGLEGRGISTSAGIRNEEKQNRYFRREIDKRRAAARAEAAVRVRECRGRFRAAHYNAALLKVAANLRLAIELEYQLI